MVSLLLSGITNVSICQEKPHTMKVDREAPWDGVERRKRERRCDEVRKCFNCNAYFPARDILNLCPDCVRKMMLHYKKDHDLKINL